MPERNGTTTAGLEIVTFIALAGEQYRIAVHNSRWPVEIPMKGLGIGQQLGWLTERLSPGGSLITAGAGA